MSKRIALYTPEMAKKLMVILSLVGLLVVPSGSSAYGAYGANKVTVFAASSLTEPFTQIGKNFEKAHPGVKIQFSFQASSTLLTQINAGAPADVFVSAEPFKGGSDYLINHVVLAVPKSSSLNKIKDLNNKVTWIQCAPEVPCGAAANAALAGEGVTRKPSSLEPKVSSAVAKLLAGEVDAAIIYKTDVIVNSKKLRAIEFANQAAAATTYQTKLLRKSTWGATFMSYLRSKSVLKILQSKGFEIK